MKRQHQKNKQVSGTKRAVLGAATFLGVVAGAAGAAQTLAQEVHAHHAYAPAASSQVQDSILPAPGAAAAKFNISGADNRGNNQPRVQTVDNDINSIIANLSPERKAELRAIYNQEVQEAHKEGKTSCTPVVFGPQGIAAFCFYPPGTGHGSYAYQLLGPAVDGI